MYYMHRHGVMPIKIRHNLISISSENLELTRLPLSYFYWGNEFAKYLEPVTKWLPSRRSNEDLSVLLVVSKTVLCCQLR